MPASPRPSLPLRAYTVVDASEQPTVPNDNDGHVRRKSQYTSSHGLPFSMRRGSRGSNSRGTGDRPSSSYMGNRRNVWKQSERYGLLPTIDATQVPSPPASPTTDEDDQMDLDEEPHGVTSYDFSRIDCEMDRAKAIGTGLWSQVYWAQPIVRSPTFARMPLTPPTTPQKRTAPPCSLFAVKSPARKDAVDVFHHEARMLTAIQRSGDAHRYIVPFYGLDPRNSSLIFEAVLGGSLENQVARLKVMTELSRHLQLRSLFANLAMDLISGLNFIHSAGMVHADIKPANILLDISEQYDLPRPVLRARFIDFSAAFIPDRSSGNNAGGTWDYMAPEQLRIQKDLNIPTFASDVWSLGITLLYTIVGDSPYTAACGRSNLFMLREAIKAGDPLGFARMDPVVQKRMTACQDFVDCCRLVLQKDRERRIGAAAWERWAENQLLDS